MSRQRSGPVGVAEFAFAPEVASPRKRPAQARSHATVLAILGATIRVLGEVGAGLTTTRVAAVAGVSVGTLYQYFGNREALITAVLTAHLDAVLSAVEAAARASAHQPREVAAEAIARAFVRVKAANVETAIVLARVYGVGRLDDRRVVAAATARGVLALAPLWRDRPEPEARRRAGVVCAALEGVVHQALETDPRLLLEPTWHDQVVALAVGAMQS